MPDATTVSIAGGVLVAALVLYLVFWVLLPRRKNDAILQRRPKQVIKRRQLSTFLVVIKTLFPWITRVSRWFEQQRKKRQLLHKIKETKKGKPCDKPCDKEPKKKKNGSLLQHTFPQSIPTRKKNDSDSDESHVPKRVLKGSSECFPEPFLYSSMVTMPPVATSLSTGRPEKPVKSRPPLPGFPKSKKYDTTDVKPSLNSPRVSSSSTANSPKSVKSESTTLDLVSTKSKVSVSSVELPEQRAETVTSSPNSNNLTAIETLDGEVQTTPPRIVKSMSYEVAKDSRKEPSSTNSTKPEIAPRSPNSIRAVPRSPNSIKPKSPKYVPKYPKQPIYQRVSQRISLTEADENDKLASKILASSERDKVFRHSVGMQSTMSRTTHYSAPPSRLSSLASRESLGSPVSPRPLDSAPGSPSFPRLDQPNEDENEKARWKQLRSMDEGVVLFPFLPSNETDRSGDGAAPRPRTSLPTLAPNSPIPAKPRKSLPPSAVDQNTEVRKSLEVARPSIPIQEWKGADTFQLSEIPELDDSFFPPPGLKRISAESVMPSFNIERRLSDSSLEENPENLVHLYKDSLKRFFQGEGEVNLATDESENSPRSSESSLKPAAWSTGSAKHVAGQCRPCGFYHKKQCRNGEACGFCHLCPRLDRRKRTAKKRGE